MPTLGAEGSLISSNTKSKPQRNSHYQYEIPILAIKESVNHIGPSEVSMPPKAGIGELTYNSSASPGYYNDLVILMG